MSFTTTMRVYYEDTDAGGVVYYANYLRFAERARTEWLRSVGIEQGQLLTHENIAFAVRACHVDFLRPARLDDLLTITTVVADIGNASISMQQAIRKDEELLATLNVRIAVVDTAFRPKRLPPSLRGKLQGMLDTAFSDSTL